MLLRQALQRTSILSNEKYRGVRLTFGEKYCLRSRHIIPSRKKPRIRSRSDITGDEIEIGFNVTYLLDALAAIDVDTVEVATDGFELAAA